MAPYHVSYDLSSRLYHSVHVHIWWAPRSRPLDGARSLAHKDAGPIRSIQPHGVTLAYIEQGHT